MKSEETVVICTSDAGRGRQVLRRSLQFRPSVYGIIVDGERIVTVRNRKTGKIWFPGGGVELGEPMLHALVRETMEETGLKVSIDRLVLATDNFFYYQPDDYAMHALIFIYLCSPVETVATLRGTVDDDEASEPRWTNLSEVRPAQLADLAEDVYPILQRLRSPAHDPHALN